MGKPTVELPDLPDSWSIGPDSIVGSGQNAAGDIATGSNNTDGTDNGGSPDFILPDGRRLGTVIEQQRSNLLANMGQLQNDPQSSDGGLGYAAGQYAAMAWPNGPLDFKNRFAGQDDPVALGRAGNFAYYAIGSGIFPDAMLDAGATGYNLYKTVGNIVKGAPTDGSDPFGPDKSAQLVRNQALAYGASLK
jgi:hypothetical protein